jgi:hypothetical protein
MRDTQATDRGGALADHRAFRSARGAAREQHVVDILGFRHAWRLVRRGSGEQTSVVEPSIRRVECDPVPQVGDAVAQRNNQRRERAGGDQHARFALFQAVEQLLGMQPYVERDDRHTECGASGVGLDVFRSRLAQHRDA